MKKNFALLLLTCFLFSPALYAAPQEIKDKAKLPLLAPDLSQRKTLKLKLDNGLEAYLISDPKIDKSGAIITVRAGSWEDPDEYPGIAHFLEHMLFLGTKKYPKESEFQRLISENGGITNAFTSDNYTAFLFSVDNSAFESAIDRFADFFKQPLFNPSGVTRELHAIDQEYAKNLENDDWRINSIDKILANPKHPYHRFSMGNSDTLSKVSQETLKAWHQRHYSANLMRLIVYSPLPLDKLKELVIADFTEIPNSDRQALNIDIPLSNPASSTPQMIYIEPIQNTRKLVLAWDLPPQLAAMKDAQPWTIACYVLGHEGKESLLAELKREELAEKLQCGASRLSPNAVQFYLEIELTDEGVQHINTVIDRCFQAIGNFKDKEVPRYLFDEIQRMASLNYQYQSREETFQFLMKHGRWLNDEEMNTYPEQTLVIQRFDPQAVHDMLSVLTPQRAHYYVLAPESLTDVPFTLHEKWMNTPYAVKTIDHAVISQWELAAAHPKIDLPPPNRFLPERLGLINKSPILPQEGGIPHPDVIMNNNKGKIYFAQDNRYFLPQVYWFFEIKTPQITMGNAPKVVLADLYVKSVADALSQFSYPASLAGLDFEVKRTDLGVSIDIHGYSENAELLLMEILKQLKGVHPTEQQFDVYKEILHREYQNVAKTPPLEQAVELFRSLLYRKFTTSKQKAVAINRITYDQFNEYLSRLFNQTYLEGSLYGNMTKGEAEKIVGQLQNALGSAPAPKELQLRPQVVMLPSQQGPFYLESSTKAQGNAVILAIEAARFDFKTRAMQQILMQAMDTPFFATLRTKQQTGYIVATDDRDVEKHLFNLFVVQSSSHDVRDLLARFELFIEGYIQELPHELPEEAFKLVKQTLITTLEQPPKSIELMGQLIHKLGFEYGGDFDWIQKRMQGFKELSYPEFLEMASENMGRQNRRRVAVLMKGSVPKDKLFEFTLIPLNRLRKLSRYAPD